MPAITAAKPLTRPAMVFAVLTLIAIAGFAGVTRLSNRYREQQKALARRLYSKGLDDQKSGRFDQAIEDFRTALGYDHDNFQYQLSLARALRDTGRTDEAEAYLVSLWERTPQDGFVNLALGRLAARQGVVNKAIQYYHNAAYGVWPSNPDLNRRNAEFELIDFLMRQGAHSQAEAELISLSATLPPDPQSQTRLAQLFSQGGKYDRALPLFESVLRDDKNSVAALAGAANAAFESGRYRAAQDYLQRLLAIEPHNQPGSELLETTNSVLQLNPYERHLRSRERTRRIQQIFQLAGKRLDSCMASKGPELTPDSPLLALRAGWGQMKSQIEHLTGSDVDVSDAAMDLVSKLEQEAQKECSPPRPADRALILLSTLRQAAEP